MNLLITNDDGINAQGIAVLARAAAPFGKVTVVAPARQCSAMSHRITLGRPLRLETVDFPVENVSAYSLDGTPADCVKAALDAILPESPMWSSPASTTAITWATMWCIPAPWARPWRR